MVSGRSSADEHERLLWNRRFHPFNVYAGTKCREKLNYAERHNLWHGRPARDHGRDGRATKGCAIIQVVLYRCAITRSGAASRVRLGIGRGQAGGIYCLHDVSVLRMDPLDWAGSTDLSLRDIADSKRQESAPAREPGFDGRAPTAIARVDGQEKVVDIIAILRYVPAWLGKGANACHHGSLFHAGRRIMPTTGMVGL